MNTEITDKMDDASGGWVFYDVECARCRRWAASLQPRLAGRGFVLAPLQSPQARATLRLSDEALLAEMRVVTRQGRVVGGADALHYLARNLGGGKMIDALVRVPGLRLLLHRLYRYVARNRSCAGGICQTTARNRPALNRAIGALPLIVMSGGTLYFGRELPPWVWMWAWSLALYTGCKWLTFYSAVTRGAKPGLAKALGYLLAWPGMDATAFFRRHTPAGNRRMTEGVIACARMFAGALLLWGAARLVFPAHPLAAGWIGMVGVVLILHFGLFQLLSLAWGAVGIDARPLMRAPLLSQSVGEFWSRRWNTAFHQLADEFVFRTICPAVGVRSSTIVVFALSGLIHELVISLPARGGYGLPTLYFLVQGAAILFEHGRLGRRLGVGRKVRGRLFTVFVTAGPACLVFHPPFVLRVILPFLNAIAAI